MTKEFVLKDKSGELKLVAGLEKTDGEEPVVVLTICAPSDYIARSLSLDEAKALGEWLPLATKYVYDSSEWRFVEEDGDGEWGDK